MIITKCTNILFIPNDLCTEIASVKKLSIIAKIENRAKQRKECAMNSARAREKKYNVARKKTTKNATSLEIYLKRASEKDTLVNKSRENSVRSEQRDNLKTINIDLNRFKPNIHSTPLKTSDNRGNCASDRARIRVSETIFNPDNFQRKIYGCYKFD